MPTFTIRTTDEEEVLLTAGAIATGVSRSQFWRGAINDKIVRDVGSGRVRRQADEGIQQLTSAADTLCSFAADPPRS